MGRESYHFGGWFGDAGRGAQVGFGGFREMGR